MLMKVHRINTQSVIVLVCPLVGYPDLLTLLEWNVIFGLGCGADIKCFD